MYTVTINDEFGQADGYYQYSQKAEARRVARDGAKALQGSATLCVVEDGADVIIEEFEYKNGRVESRDDQGNLISGATFDLAD